MKIWDELNENIKGSTRTWVDWARRNAQELGDAGVRHVERQDLLSERRRVVSRLGEYVANRFLLEDKKTVRSDSPGVGEAIDRVRAIDQRLQELESREAKRHPDEGDTDSNET